MSRFHTTPEGLIPFTAEEEAYRDAEEAQAQAKKIAKAQTKYKDDRAAEYPPVADYLDGIVKNDQAQIQTYIDACLAVKAKYPKS
jgi:hypothetical protein